MTDSSHFTAATASDPSTPLDVLAQIARDRADLRPQVAANPAAYPGLLTWLGGLGDPRVDEALRARAAAAPPPPPAPTPDATRDLPPLPPAPSASSAPAVSLTPPEPAPGTRGRTRVLVASLVGALVLLGGGVAAYALVFSKLGGAGSAEAAVEQLFEGAVEKDMMAMVGVIAPSETEGLSAMQDRLAHLTASEEEQVEYQRLVGELLDTVSLSMDGLELEVEEVDEGLSKVYLNAGTVEVDVDTEAFSGVIREFAPMLEEIAETQGAGDIDFEAQLDEGLEEMVAEMEAELPLTLDVADLEVPTAAGETSAAFLMTVEEEGDWYVSPMMTLGEYVAVVSGLERASMPTADDVTTFDTAEEAGAGFVSALTGMIEGDVEGFASALALPERRALFVYGSMEEFEGAELPFEVTASEFEVREENDGRARLGIERLVMEGDGNSVAIEGTCVTMTEDGVEGERTCLEDFSLLTELGLTDLAIVAVEHDGSWNVSVLDTILDAAAVVTENVYRLDAEGKLEDEEWLQEQLEPFGTELGDPLGSGLGAELGTDLGGDLGGDLGTELGENLGLDLGGGDADFTAMKDACGSGDMAACDQLYLSTPLGSDEETFGSTCGGTSEPTWGGCVNRAAEETVGG